MQDGWCKEKAYIFSGYKFEHLTNINFVDPLDQISIEYILIFVEKGAVIQAFYSDTVLQTYTS